MSIGILIKVSAEQKRSGVAPRAGITLGSLSMGLIKYFIKKKSNSQVFILYQELLRALELNV